MERGWGTQVRDRTGLYLVDQWYPRNMPVSSSQKLRSVGGSDQFVVPLSKPTLNGHLWFPCPCGGPVAAVLAHGFKSFLSHQDHTHGSYARRGQDLGSLQAEEQQEQLGRCILDWRVPSNHQILHLSSQRYRSVMKCLSFQVHFPKIQSNWRHFDPDVRIRCASGYGCHLQHLQARRRPWCAKLTWSARLKWLRCPINRRMLRRRPCHESDPYHGGNGATCSHCMPMLLDSPWHHPGLLCEGKLSKKDGEYT